MIKLTSNFVCHKYIIFINNESSGISTNFPTSNWAILATKTNKKTYTLQIDRFEMICANNQHWYILSHRNKFIISNEYFDCSASCLPSHSRPLLPACHYTHCQLLLHACLCLSAIHQFRAVSLFVCLFIWLPALPIHYNIEKQIKKFHFPDLPQPHSAFPKTANDTVDEDTDCVVCLSTAANKSLCCKQKKKYTSNFAYYSWSSSCSCTFDLDKKFFPCLMTKWDTEGANWNEGR